MDRRYLTVMAKTVGATLLGLTLTACQTTGTPQTASPPAQNNLPAAEISDPGILQFKINPSGVGAYYGWQMQITKAARNKGFKPFTTEQLSAGQTKEYTLWPDSYTVTVYRLGDLKYNGQIEIHPGETTVVYADYGLLSDNIVISRQIDPFRAHPELDTTAWRAPISTTYEPETLFAEREFRAEYTGPQNNGERVGEGTVDITRNGLPFAEILNAEITDEKITGDITYADGREVDGDYQNAGHQLTPGSTTKWPDGTVFTGSYTLFEPQDGELKMADGTIWQGPVRERKPFGQGRLTRWEGDWMDLPDGSVFPGQTGAFVCGGEMVAVGECYYYGGKKLSGPEELATLMERDRQIAAKAAAGKAAQEAATQSPRQPETGQAGCRNASGTFNDNTGNSTLRLDSPGQGSGNFISYTYGGAARYRFEIGFTFTTTPDSISVTYGNGVYSDAASGKVLQRMSAPSGTVPCRYDGTVLVFDGVEYRR
ncbi:MAG: hypothetical protein RIB30_19245 [Thalassospira sp.]|uniref:hypothetical protein n=1 Tax=Thalassospira sp. TaxID=1912094 RepID=UPI0032EFFC37